MELGIIGNLFATSDAVYCNNPNSYAHRKLTKIGKKKKTILNSWSKKCQISNNNWDRIWSKYTQHVAGNLKKKQHLTTSGEMDNSNLHLRYWLAILESSEISVEFPLVCYGLWAEGYTVCSETITIEFLTHIFRNSDEVSKCHWTFLDTDDISWTHNELVARTLL